MGKYPIYIFKSISNISMKHSLKDVIAKSRRVNDIENKRLHPFASKVSIYFSWVFINLGLTPNQVTGLFFLTGFAGAIILLVNSWTALIISYLLFRLHIIIDVSDGEVARYTKLFSINGSYWDSMIHAVLYPLFFICMCIAQYYSFGDSHFLIIASIGGIVVSLKLSVKNNYYRAMLFNNSSLSDFKEKTNSLSKKGLRFKIFNFISETLSFEGLFIGYFTAYYFNIASYFKYLFLIYLCSFFLIVLVKFQQLSTKGFYRTRS